MVDGRSTASAPTYELPDADERQSRLSRLYRLVEYHRAAGREVAVVQGLGAAGISWCARAVQARRDDDAPRYFVVGLDLPRFVSYQNVARLNEGTLPLPDRAIADAMGRAALEAALVATIEDVALSFADYVVIAVGDDPSGQPLDAPVGAWSPRVEGLGPALRSVGRWQNPSALVLVSHSLSPERAAQAARVLAEARQRRGLGGQPRLAWLVPLDEPAAGASQEVAGLDEEASAAARAFLASLSSFPHAEVR